MQRPGFYRTLFGINIIDPPSHQSWALESLELLAYAGFVWFHFQCVHFSVCKKRQRKGLGLGLYFKMLIEACVSTSGRGPPRPERTCPHRSGRGPPRPKNMSTPKCKLEAGKLLYGLHVQSWESSKRSSLLRLQGLSQCLVPGFVEMTDILAGNQPHKGSTSKSSQNGDPMVRHHT